MKKTVVLILVVCSGAMSSPFDKEVRKIENTIRRALRKDLFEIRVRTADCSGDIRRALAEESPQIVHICGDVTENGSLVLEKDRNRQFISSKGLAALLKLHDYVQCVLINACHSSTLAAAISPHIRYVIAVNQSVDRNAAIVFIQGFYDRISDINSNDPIVQRAFDEGIVALELEDLLEDSVPRLWESNFQYKVELTEKVAKEIYRKY